MKISKKCQYALKAIFELAWREQGELVRTNQIAKAQQMSLRFTEIILNELKHGGFVDSRRGNEGGYMLARNPKNLTVIEVIEFIQGPISIVPAQKTDPAKTGNDVFKQFWQKVNDAISEVCSSKTFAGLVKAERAKRNAGALNYSI